MRSWLLAAIVSGAPSTAYAVAAGRDPLEATKAAGALVVGERAPGALQVAAAAPVHLALSWLWGTAIERSLPERNRLAWGVAAGLAVAALDLGVVGRRFPAIRRLPLLPQLADHALFGAVAARRDRSGS
ncbi:MAG TPA: hypothetical protein VI408_08920 [Gaiellaceae bacterium]